MNKVKKGDYVVRKSYGKDIIFYVKRIIKTSNRKIVILCGLSKRIEADSDIEDLEIVNNEYIKEFTKNEKEKNENRVRKELKNYEIGILEKEENRWKQKLITGKILHLDGDKKYSEKSYYYYKKMGLDAVVKNIPEYKQPKVVYKLLEIYRPDILIITGHDGMIKKGTNYSDIYNYRNSRHFINTVKEARKYDIEHNKDTVIFARSMSKLF